LDDRFDDSEKELDTARAALLDACRNDLVQRIQGAAPLGVDATEWTTSGAGIRKALDDAGATASGWNERYKALRQAQAAYVSVVVKGLAKEATRLADAHDPRADRFRTIATQLTETLARDTDEAAALYAQLLAEVTAPPSGEAIKGHISLNAGAIAAYAG